MGEADAWPAQAILDAAHEAYIAIDARDLIVAWNLEAERTFGYTREEAIGRELAATIIPERARHAHLLALQRFLDTGEGSVIGRRVEMTALHREGYEFPVELTVSALRAPGAAAREVTFHALMHDISARKLAEQVLVAMQAATRAMARAPTPRQALEALLATLGRSMRWEVGGYWASTEDGTLQRVVSWSAEEIDADAFIAHAEDARLTAGVGLPGRALARVEPVWVEDFSSEVDFPGLEAARQAGLHAAICMPVHRGERIVGVLEFFARELHVRDHSMAGALASVGEQVGELLGVLEERHALLQSLERLALTDQLTGLPNRRAWQDGLIRELARARRDGHPVCIAVIDLDDFKRYNDEHGHQAGDRLLTETARAWSAQLRAGDLLVRYGGEEFATLIPSWPLESAIMVVERLRAVTPQGLTCSAGVACWDRSESVEELFARADRALYAAKQAGRNRTVGAG